MSENTAGGHKASWAALYLKILSLHFQGGGLLPLIVCFSPYLPVFDRRKLEG